ncbi:PQQ-dependent dehydrogenase, methanol/ethanol family [Novosphingobium album (ex Liu et al. 2023)]|uniref:PQQ-dependent dehydrogenase, methanol/ethanol family n=1 Tax=Novosphingobium album (ex Liu et al. 2023) TaxID=3031130 RepID=A0ABT5WXD6_9SPHN|nr:PQQ-dependent dehydrogenase, methanol/ethanol family [Novosphingobium album (ex Liu et al. 2023)]MDE8654571.1 PQQ-dependent dehydrogenase, methanol/ethanol family [Novosphingobium album (ex Liu et al. 2023)]
MTGRKFAWLALVAGTLGIGLGLASCNRPAQPIEEAMVADPDNWPSWGRTGHETHYSPLDEIDAGNVGELKLAWHYDLEPGYTASTPLEAEGKVFITSGHSHIRAFDAETGKQLWEYDGGTRERATSALQLSWGNKGIAYDAGHVFLVTTDGYVISLDARTGKEAWKTYDYPDPSPRNSNGAPRVFGGKVIVGFGGADISPARGFVSAYDEKTGKLAWRFYTTPGDDVSPANRKAEEVMRKTWPGGWKNPDGTRRGGGGTAWNAFSYDPELNLIYLGLGNGFPYNRDKRSPDGGDNLFLASIVAVDADTGEYRWHYQVCPGEQWDCTATTDMTLATLEIDGKERKVLMQAPKNGFFYVLDRKTGEFISAEKIAKVTWADHIDGKTGRPVENPGIRYNGKPGLFELWPGPTGAHSWMPQAYSPQTGLVYLPVIEQGALIGDGQKGGGEITAGMGVTLLPEVELPGSHKSFLKAWNPVTQKEAWKVELPGNWPGGVMASAGGLVFQGQIDGKFVARDARTGKQLWSFQTESPIVGAPISYRVNGRQYVTVITGSGGNGAGIDSPGNAAYRTDYRLPRRVLTFALGGTDTIPPFRMPDLTPPDDPDFKPDLARAQAGAMLFGTRACLVCHGWNAIGGGAAPDLRYSPIITDAATFRQIVKEGGLKMNGMPPFPQLTDQELETIRFYLRARARAAPAERQALLDKARAAQASHARPADFAGKWNIVIQSPVGEQKAVMDLKVNGNVITGKVTADQGTVDIAGGIANGRARMEGKASMPMPITIAYDVTVKDGRMTGENSNGPFGTFPMAGTR